MSKGSLFWANASGKLGQVVNYRAGGEQRARSYVRHIKNPKTIAQMKNRLLMLNVVSAFRSLKPLLIEAFPQRPSKQSAFNAFVQANKQKLGYYITKEDLESGACVPYGMVVSKGSTGLNLRPSIMELRDVTDGDVAARYGWAVTNILDWDGISVEVPQSADSFLYKPSAEELSKLFAEHSVISLPSMAQITTIGATYGAIDSDLDNDMWQLGYRVHHLQANNAYARSYGFTQDDFDLEIALHISSVTENASAATKTLKFDALLIGSPKVDVDTLVKSAAGIVLSFKSSEGVMVSNSSMSAIPTRYNGQAVEDPTADFIWGGFYAQQVLEAYGYQTGGILQSTASNEAPQAPDDEETGGEDLG